MTWAVSYQCAAMEVYVQSQASPSVVKQAALGQDFHFSTRVFPY